MSIDEKATIGSILAALQKEGVKTADVAKQIQGISEKPFRNALKAAGYEFSNKAPKGWHFVGEGEQPLDGSIFDYVKNSSSSVKRSSPVIHQEFTPSNTGFTESNKHDTTSDVEVITDSPIVHQQFTNDEVSMIKEMLGEWQRVVMQAATQTHEEKLESQSDLTLHDRIKQLPQGDKTRKTIVIDKEIGNQLDEFCKGERVNKSDVLHLALMDFLEKYTDS